MSNTFAHLQRIGLGDIVDANVAQTECYMANASPRHTILFDRAISLADNILRSQYFSQLQQQLDEKGK